MILQDIYMNSPRIIQELGIGLYGLKRNYSRYNDIFKEKLDFLMDSYYWDKDRIERYQVLKLRELVNHVGKSKYYHELIDIEGKEISSLKDLQKLPITDKKGLRKNAENILINEDKNIHYFKTSGTTGTPLQIGISTDVWAKEYAFVWRQRKMAGINEKDKCASFVGRMIVSSEETKNFWRYNFADNQLLFSVYHMNENNLEKYTEKFNSWKCDYVQGYPSAIYLLAKYAVDNNIKLHKPKAIFTSSEMLLEYQESIIEEAFNTMIHDFYGNVERAGIITRCNAGNYHVNVESGILEIIDNKFYWTSFLNTTTPLIRYEIGDMGKFEDSREVCKCGSSFPLIRQIDGRMDDYIVTSSGRKIGHLGHLIQPAQGIASSQLIQTGVDSLIINVVPDKGFDKNSMDKVIRNAKNYLGDMDIKWNIVDELERTSNGKVKYIIRKI